ncbi:MAG TPA: hypothetical protein VLS96_19670 [Nodosilinea sp.]|nr:hypothetical protein [Nodosilinea sp.]
MSPKFIPTPKRRPGWRLALLLSPVILACTPTGNRPETGAPPEPSASSPPAVESFTTDDLFAQGGGGCGMTLWHRDDGLRPSGYLFFNGLAEPAAATALMKLDGEFVRFRRTTASGAEFYGQYTAQTFISPDNAVQLQVETRMGSPGEIESVAVEGTLQLQSNGDTITIPVLGDAGC